MTKQSSANLGLETKLWAATDKLSGNLDPDEYKHVVLGLKNPPTPGRNTIRFIRAYNQLLQAY